MSQARSRLFIIPPIVMNAYNVQQIHFTSELLPLCFCCCSYNFIQKHELFAYKIMKRENKNIWTI